MVQTLEQFSDDCTPITRDDKTEKMITVRDERFVPSGGIPMFEARWTTMDGIPGGPPRNKVRLLRDLGKGKYRMKVLVLAGVPLRKSFEIVGTLTVLNQ